MKEMAKRKNDWNMKSELDSVKVVVAAIVPTTGYQAQNFLFSGPLESPKKDGDEITYNAIFPLKGRESNGAPTRIVMPGLIQKEEGNEYKRQTVELLITMVFGNEAFTLGKATLMVTGEEFKTKQSDLPIDTTKSTVLKVQKKSTFPMKRSASFSSKMSGGSIGPTSFKFDRRKRKYHLMKDSVLRAYLKVTSSDPYAQQLNGGVGMGSIANMSNRYRQDPSVTMGPSVAMGQHHNGIPKVISPSMGFQPTLNPSTNSMGSQGRVRGSPSPLPDHREHSGYSTRSGHRSHSNSRTQVPNMMQGRTPPPGHGGRARSHSRPRSRSQSTPRHKQRSSGFGNQPSGSLGLSAYGGSSYNGAGSGNGGGPGSQHGFGGSSRGRSSSRTGQGGQQQYGGSSYGAPRKPQHPQQYSNNQGSQYGGSSFQRAGSSNHNTRSQSPQVFNRNY